MDPLTGALIGAGGDLGGAVVQGLFNAREADKSRDWQTAMSNTAYQRAAGDLQAAGLNRVLALGSPASTPSGATASISAPSIGSSATNARAVHQQIAVGKEQENLLRDQQEKTRSETALADAQKFQVDSNTALNWANVDLSTANTALSKHNVLKVLQDISASQTGQDLARSQIPYYQSSSRWNTVRAETMESQKGLWRAANPWVNWLTDLSEGIFNSARDAHDGGALPVTGGGRPMSRDDARRVQSATDALLGRGVLKFD